MKYGGYFEHDKKEQRIDELEQIMSLPTFWDNRCESEKVISELNQLKRELQEVENIKNNFKINKLPTFLQKSIFLMQFWVAFFK